MNTTELKKATRRDLNKLDSINLESKLSKKDKQNIFLITINTFLKMWVVSMLPLAIFHIKEYSTVKIQSYSDLADVFWCLGLNFIITVILLMLMLAPIKNYVIFHRQISPKLKLGEMLNDFAKRIVQVSYVSFLVVILCLSFLFIPTVILGAEIMAFFITSAIVIAFVVIKIKHLELDRLLYRIRDRIRYRNRPERLYM